MKKCFLFLILSLLLILFLFGCEKSESIVEDTSISDIANASIGDVVKYGDYNGNALKWHVVCKEEGLYLLVTEGIVIEKPYNDEGGSTDSNSDLFYANEWSNCSLREWLNDDFYYNAFSDTAREHIVKCELTNNIEEAYAKSGGLDTKDRVFILSYSECDKFLSQNNLLDIDGKTFWLRNPSGTNGLSAKTCSGRLSADSNNSANVDSKLGVRPAIWVTDKGITKAELNVPAATQERRSSPYSPDDFGYYDYNGDGQISDEEFQDAAEYWMDQQEAKGSSASSNDPDDFGYYDYNGDGQISDEEFQDATEYWMDQQDKND